MLFLKQTAGITHWPFFAH